MTSLLTNSSLARQLQPDVGAAMLFVLGHAKGKSGGEAAGGDSPGD